jgi:hypothetical protein
MLFFNWKQQIKYRKETLTMSNQEEVKNGNGDTPKGDVEFNMDFEPETETELISIAIWLKAGEENSIIINRHLLGKKINGFYEKKYGVDELQRIAKLSGYSKSTLHKACQFAKNFSDQKLNELLTGPFQISWRDISQNLKVNPDDFVKAYLESATAEEFRNAVTELKDPNGVTEKFKPLYQHSRGTLNCEYCQLMKNQIGYQEYQLKMKDMKIYKLETRVAELIKKLSQFDKEVPKSNAAHLIGNDMDQDLAARAA